MNYKYVKLYPLFNLSVIFFVSFSIINKLDLCNFDDNKDLFKNKVISNVNSTEKLVYIKNEINPDFYIKKLNYIS